MLRDFSAVINTIDGVPFTDDKGDALTLKRVVMDSIGAPLEGDQSMTGDEKMRLYDLATRVAAGVRAAAPVDLASEEVSVLKSRIGRAWGVFIVGPAFKMLDTDYAAPIEQTPQG